MVDFGSINIRSMRAKLDLPRSDETPIDQTNLESRNDSSSLAPAGRAQSDERYSQLLQANYEQLLSEAYDQFEVSLSATQVILVQEGGKVLLLLIRFHLVL